MKGLKNVKNLWDKNTILAFKSTFGRLLIILVNMKNKVFRLIIIFMLKYAVHVWLNVW